MKQETIVKNLIRDDISSSPPFTVSELPHKAKLDQNESPFDLPDDVKVILLKKLREYQWNRYPQPSLYANVKKTFAKAIGFPPDNLILTIGCDQLIQGIYLICGGHDRNALVFEPTYPMFSHAARFNQTDVTRIQLAAEEIPTKDHINRSEHNIIFIVAPNNPNGAFPEEGVIETALSKNSLIFVDESYVDFSKRTWSHHLKEHPNLFIARSASKSCMAGLRLGFGIGHPDIINAMETTFTAPYHLSCLQLVIAKHFDLILPHLKNHADTIISERERVANQFKEMEIPFIPSQGNFILFKVKNPPGIFQRLSESGVRIRSLHTIPGLSDYVRVTIGKKEENNLFLEELRTLPYK
ncbi:histidinol-phosphate/aromatic aminotransferase and cobyric acid decarboxylase [Candidatus Scalindua japonica]|uniref:Histidinol-phosphate/aromatic aminotransferase and cobyric acid decarboxylase n=1 Tax=Candidatus Scalindua japonica TaxID=1284222 RepID=A0A286U1F8_9BACT|nr:histidinol-phosphate transaminase [Candidatus Scalindua japonica]GAX61952.1 histidinol-phosphate/aromatic aminotransferase and cobyric acid decarboxylase [Candidatus Scalindua japonica]